MRRELYRKSIHLGSLFIPITYKYFIDYDRTLALKLIPFVFFFFIAFEIFRRHTGDLGKFLDNYFGFILREHEKKGALAGSFYLLLGVFFSVILFEGEIVFLSLSFLSIGDTFAAVIGKNFGKIRIGKKSLEGTIACFVSCVIFGIIFGTNSFMLDNFDFYLMIILAAFGTSLAELFGDVIDDNLKIPLACGLIMSLFLYYI